MSSRKSCRSAIKGETVTNIRKYLQKTHLLWTNRHNNKCFDLSADVACKPDKQYQMQQFCFDFVLGNHMKRQGRNRNKIKV